MLLSRRASRGRLSQSVPVHAFSIASQIPTFLTWRAVTPFIVA